MTFSSAPSPEHAGINRVHVGVVHGALGRDLHEWRPPQVADFVRIKGSGRYAPGQTEEAALADLGTELDALERRFPGLKASLTPEHQIGRPAMPSFEVSKTSPIVQAINRAYRTVRGTEQPTRRPPAARLLRDGRGPSLPQGGDGRDRLRPRRALQHDAGRARGHRRFSRHGENLHAHDA